MFDETVYALLSMGFSVIFLIVVVGGMFLFIFKLVVEISKTRNTSQEASMEKFRIIKWTDWDLGKKSQCYILQTTKDITERLLPFVFIGLLIGLCLSISYIHFFYEHIFILLLALFGPIPLVVCIAYFILKKSESWEQIAENNSLEELKKLLKTIKEKGMSKTEEEILEVEV